VSQGVVKKCLECGKPILKGVHGNRKTCSPQCALDRLNRQSRDRRALMSQDPAKYEEFKARSREYHRTHYRNNAEYRKKKIESVRQWWKKYGAAYMRERRKKLREGKKS